MGKYEPPPPLPPPPPPSFAGSPYAAGQPPTYFTMEWTRTRRPKRHGDRRWSFASQLGVAAAGTWAGFSVVSFSRALAWTRVARWSHTYRALAATTVGSAWRATAYIGSGVASLVSVLSPTQFGQTWWAGFGGGFGAAARLYSYLDPWGLGYSVVAGIGRDILAGAHRVAIPTTPGSYTTGTPFPPVNQWQVLPSVHPYYR